jgi:hypothetical protein
MAMRFPSVLKKAYIPVLLGLILLTFCLVPFQAFLPAVLYWEARPTVANGEELGQDLGFFVFATFVRIEVYVYGGDQRITTCILSPDNNVLTQTVVGGSRTFTFDVRKNGHYSLNMKNDLSQSPQNDKQVLIKVYYYMYNIAFLASGTAILLLGLSVMIYKSFKQGNNSQTANPSE